MIVRKNIDEKTVKIYSDKGLKIKRKKDGKVFSEAIQTTANKAEYEEVMIND